MQGDRFGGALDAAAKEFSEAYDAGMIPMEFVNSKRKKGELIMGIGHRVKSVKYLFDAYISSPHCLSSNIYLWDYFNVQVYPSLLAWIEMLPISTLVAEVE